MRTSTRGRAGNYKGMYIVKNPDKWINAKYIDKNGYKVKAVEFLSLWERQTFVYMDKHPDVVKVGAETVIIPYICETDGKQHKYMVDLEVHYSDGTKHLIEIKPKRQTKKPKDSKIITASKLNEHKVFVKNESKWKSARYWATKHGYTFSIWTEETLKNMNIIFKA